MWTFETIMLLIFGLGVIWHCLLQFLNRHIVPLTLDETEYDAADSVQVRNMSLEYKEKMEFKLVQISVVCAVGGMMASVISSANAESTGKLIGIVSSLFTVGWILAILFLYSRYNTYDNIRKDLNGEIYFRLSECERKLAEHAWKQMQDGDTDMPPTV